MLATFDDWSEWQWCGVDLSGLVGVDVKPAAPTIGAAGVLLFAEGLVCTCEQRMHRFHRSYDDVGLCGYIKFLQTCHEVFLGTVAFDAVAVGAKELQILNVIGAPR